MFPGNPFFMSGTTTLPTWAAGIVRGVVVGTGSTTANLTLFPDGTWQTQVLVGGQTPVIKTGSWFSPSPTSGIGTSYYARATLTTAGDDAPTTGALNTWFSLSSNVNWSDTANSKGHSLTTPLRIDIADASLNVVGSGNVTLIVEVSSS